MFCSSLWIYLILVAIAVKSRCFCQPDGISITLLEEDVYCTENLYVHRCLQQKFMRNIFTTGKGVFYIYCCLRVEMSRNARDPQNQTYKICSTKRD